jgi:putative DNA primase/helicase
MTEISSAAQGKWRGILFALGVEESFLTGKNGPCPLCGGKDRWRFTDFNDTGAWVCTHCGTGDGFELLKLLRNWSYAEAAKEIERVVGTVKAEPQRRKSDPRLRFDRIRAELEPRNAAVDLYLAARGLTMPRTLRAHPALTYYTGRDATGTYAALVAGVLAPSGKTASLHVTYVHQGRKAPVESPRKLLTPDGTLDGAAIRLFPVEPHLGVAEGIETALSAAVLYALPVWATVNTALMEKWVPPPVVRRVTIFADNDLSYAGFKAAYALAFKLVGLGVDVEVRAPQQPGTDFNDVLLGQSSGEF